MIASYTSSIGTGTRRVLVLSALLIGAGLLLISIAGCHTVKGVGRDIEAIGHEGQEMIDGKR